MNLPEQKKRKERGGRGWLRWVILAVYVALFVWAILSTCDALGGLYDRHFLFLAWATLLIGFGCFIYSDFIKKLDGSKEPS